MIKDIIYLLIACFLLYNFAKKALKMVYKTNSLYDEVLSLQREYFSLMIEKLKEEYKK